MAWVFALSLLSNCYCQPAFSAKPASAQAMPSNCPHHHGAKAKDCAPRFNTDQFESSIVKFQPADAVAISLSVEPVQSRAPSALLTRFFEKSFFDSSPPPFYLAHHAFLI